MMSVCTRVSSCRQGGHHVAQKLSSTTLPFRSPSVTELPSTISTVKSGAVSPAFTSVVDSASVSAPFLALRLPHEGSSRMTAMIAAISASITHSDLLLFLVAIVLQFYQRSDLLSGKDLAEVARGVHVEDDDPEAVLAAERAM